MMESMSSPGHLAQWALAAVLLVPLLLCSIAGADGSEEEVLGRSLVDRGDTSRLQQVMAKARRGDPITVAVIGGSITQGASATAPEKRYGDRVAAWWRERFPKSTVT
ncbi:MAG TPA: hypothetical protein VGN26_06790, partial [Armatimonadota bacterium]